MYLSIMVTLEIEPVLRIMENTFVYKDIKYITTEKEIASLIEKNYDRIYKYVFYHLKNKETAEDITQEVFLKFLRTFHAYSEYGKAMNYLYVIAKNCINDYYRSYKKNYITEFQEDIYDSGLNGVIDNIIVLDAVNTLNEFEKEIILLKYYQELKLRDVAKILKRPVSTVSYHLKCAERKLKELLKGDI